MKLNNNKIIRHLSDFPFIWIAFVLLFGAALTAVSGHWQAAKVVGIAAVLMVAVLLLVRPMNAVYGLMGTTGSIRLFFWTFLLITFFFAGVYQLGFLHDAGITYDVNQPHIDFDLYSGKVREPITVRTPVRRDTCVYIRVVDGEELRETVVRESSEELGYQPIDFWFTWRNTMLTALMQEPPDFFSAVSTFNATLENGQGDSVAADLDRQKAVTFQYILLLQILISWIFFGVFVSLLYSKFRYEL